MGVGSYEAGQSYNYVGQGCGAYEQAVVSTAVGWKIRPLCIIIGLLCVVGIVVFLLLPKPDSTTAAPGFCDDRGGMGAGLTAEQQMYCCRKFHKFCAPGQCLIWGDPHILTFDHSKVDFLDEGEAWIVKSSTVWIQGRYRATQWTNGLAATDAIAIGGPFMKGHVLKVASLETGMIVWDDQPICTTFPSNFDAAGLGSIRYNDQGTLVDPAMASVGKGPRVVHVELPLGVHLQIMRWDRHVNVRITMSRQPQQDGGCGNFDGMPGDDTKSQIDARVGLSVSQADLLFKTWVPPKAAPHPQLTDCVGAKRTNAEQACKARNGNLHGEEFNSCVYDVCFAGPQYAAQDANY